LFPWFVGESLSGGAIWYDAQLHNPERLTLSFLQAAAAIGAVPVNYLRVDRLHAADGTVQGAQATDCLTGTKLQIRARAVLVAAGPWTDQLIATIPGPGQRPVPGQALGLNLVINRRLADVAFGVRARSGRQEDPVCGGHRFLFSTPQGQVTLLGTWYTAHTASPRAARERGLRALLQEVNDACPGLDLTDGEVSRCQWGWLPLKDGKERGRPDALAERPQIADYGRALGVRNLLSVEGVKYTTARLVAEQAVDRVFASLGRTSPPCRTAEVRLQGTEAEISTEPGTEASRGEIVKAVREEMAVKLTDIVFRRTTLGIVPGPERVAVEAAARVAGSELGWDARRQGLEVDAVMQETAAPGPALEAVG
jgi:glycerol-3-phosphate dehydrogenase